MDYQETKAICEVIDEVTDILYDLHEKYNDVLSENKSNPYLTKECKTKKEYQTTCLNKITAIGDRACVGTRLNKIHGEDEKQLDIIFSPNDRVIVEAPAGCGKTASRRRHSQTSRNRSYSPNRRRSRTARPRVFAPRPAESRRRDRDTLLPRPPW